MTPQNDFKHKPQSLHPSRRRVVTALAAGAASVALPSLAQPAWPNKPVRIIVPYTPGGFTDQMARLIQNGLQTRLGQPVTIDNKPGANSIIGVDALAKAPADFAARSIILFTADHSTAETFVPRLEALGVDRLQTFPTIDTLLVRLDGFLSTAHMGTRLYATGTEGFIGRVVQSGITHDIVPGSILTEHRGSMARRVQCVHCKGITENITLSHFTCGHCGLTLFVRDHYSRRLGAFQGVCANAEDRTLVPSITELFP